MDKDGVFFSPQDRRSTTTEGLFALVAAYEALEDCKWKPVMQEQKERTVSQVLLLSQSYHCQLVISQESPVKLNY